MTLTLSSPKKPRAAKKPKPAVSHDELKRIADRIEVMKANRLDELVEELKAEGAKVKGDAFVEVKLHGISGTSTAGLRVALENWAMAARRSVLQAGG